MGDLQSVNILLQVYETSIVKMRVITESKRNSMKRCQILCEK